MKKKIFLFVVVAFLLIVVGAVLVADLMFGAVRTAPEVSCTTLIKPETRGVIVFNPPLAQKLIKQRILAMAPKAPEALVDATLPYQVAVLFDVDYGMSVMNGTVFLNERRLGPAICQWVNQQAIPEPYSNVIKEEMVAEKRGVLTRKAVWNLDRDAMGKLRWEWKNTKLNTPLEPEGGHMLEVVLDNRDGGGLVVIATVHGMLFGTPLDSYMSSSAKDMATAYSTLRIQANITENNELKAKLMIGCSPTADTGMIDFIPRYFDMIKNVADEQLAPMGITVTCEPEEVKDGHDFAATYTFSNADQLLSAGVLGRFVHL